MPIGFRGLQAPEYRPALSTADKKALPNLQISHGDQVCFSGDESERQGQKGWFRPVALFSKLLHALLMPLRWPLSKIGVMSLVQQELPPPTPINLHASTSNPFATTTPESPSGETAAESGTAHPMGQSSATAETPTFSRPKIRPFADSPYRRVLYPGIREVKNSRQLFWNAVFAGEVEKVQKFLDKGIDVNTPQVDGYTPLHSAAARGDLAMANVLLGTKGINIEAEDLRGTRPIHKAVLGNHYTLVDALIAKKVDIEAHSWYETRPLQMAANLGHTKIAHTLIEKGAEVNAQSWMGSTPLYWAADHGHLDIVKDLLAHGAKVTIRNNYGETPLHGAAKGGHLAVMQELLKAEGASASMVDKQGETPLHRAAAHDHPEVLQLLVDHGGDLQAPATNGQTPQAILDKRRKIRANKFA